MLLKAVNEQLRRNGIEISNGTIVDVTIIEAPSSAKNKDAERDAEMNQAGKGKQRYFGIKAHGGGQQTKLIRTIRPRRPSAGWPGAAAPAHARRLGFGAIRPTTVRSWRFAKLPCGRVTSPTNALDGEAECIKAINCIKSQCRPLRTFPQKRTSETDVVVPVSACRLWSPSS